MQTEAAQSKAEVSTLNARMNRVLDRIEGECDRIDRVLGRVNGTPQKDISVGSVAQISPMRAMTNVVEQIEGQADRLSSLASNLETVA